MVTCDNRRDCVLNPVFILFCALARRSLAISVRAVCASSFCREIAALLLDTADVALSFCSDSATLLFIIAASAPAFCIDAATLLCSIATFADVFAPCACISEYFLTACVTAVMPDFNLASSFESSLELMLFPDAFAMVSSIFLISSCIWPKLFFTSFSLFLSSSNPTGKTNLLSSIYAFVLNM
ncbi:MAG: hypothetical protein BWY95_02479 [Bacteroidetes bacterium ADurb.BinA104]|nr:MAG: hypothetical protein BWY95_02479 [Bacteroidetes bacterium ADurb.BinA104]